MKKILILFVFACTMTLSAMDRQQLNVNVRAVRAREAAANEQLRAIIAQLQAMRSQELARAEEMILDSDD